MLSAVLIGISLAMDAFAISVSAGMSIPGFRPRQGVRMALWFGGFQFGMPLLGWALGVSVADYIVAVDHWVAFGLLALIGGHMIWESLRGEDGDEAPADLSARRLCVLAIATSIDALAVGISMAFMEVDILLSAVIIGVVTFAISLAGALLGRYLGKLLQKWAGVAGGIVLLGIGIKILVEHLMG